MNILCNARVNQSEAMGFIQYHMIPHRNATPDKDGFAIHHGRAFSVVLFVPDPDSEKFIKIDILSDSIKEVAGLIAEIEKKEELMFLG